MRRLRAFLVIGLIAMAGSAALAAVARTRALPARAPAASGTVVRPQGVPGRRAPASSQPAPPASVYEFLRLVGVLHVSGAGAVATAVSDPCAADPADEERGECVPLLGAPGGGRVQARVMG